MKRVSATREKETKVIPTWSRKEREKGRAEMGGWGTPQVARKGSRKGAPGRGNSTGTDPWPAGTGVDWEGGTGGLRGHAGPWEGVFFSVLL